MPWKSEKDFHQSLGQFCADFEQVCSEMEICVRVILHKNGLVNMAIQEILLAGRTAEPLTRLLQSLVGQVLVNDNYKRAIFNKVFKRTQNLIENRNSLIHSKWFTYGNDLEQEQTEVISVGQRLYANKSGADTRQIVIDFKMLNDLIDECRVVSIMISLLSRCIEGIRSVEECFSIEKENLVINYEALKPINVKA